MSRGFFSLITAGSAVCAFAAFAGGARSNPPELSFSTYDAFMAPGGPGPELQRAFEARCPGGCRLRAISNGDAGQIVTRLEQEAARKARPSAQVMLGIDQQLWPRAVGFAEPWGSWRPRDSKALLPEAREQAQAAPAFLPFDLGALAFMADQATLRRWGLPAPRSLRDLLKPEYRRRILLEDPRTSSPGLAFLLYTREVLKSSPSEWMDFWKRLRSQWLTLTPSWSAAYGLFASGEAPLVWSYTTSQAYHREHGDREGRYQALLFDEGQPLQVEGAALVRGSFQSERQRALAREFLNFLISPEAQAILASRNWMLPVRRGVSLPSAFRGLPEARRRIRLPTDPAEVRRALSEWSQAVEGSGP